MKIELSLVLLLAVCAFGQSCGPPGRVNRMKKIDIYHWNDGSKINSSTLDIIRQLVNNNQLQGVVGAAFRPIHIDEALHHVVNPNAIGSTIIKF
ncbi:hypothetical protein HCN44_002699 [Aphidius gifuensis]|uniref:Uncharacterized protein n=1 Tax=Aphidius gifuensis TaxID=684658 RepID=A0A834XRD4_APHGI|nr:hypothetical protein HCN44_002699 [Aphidius gifuensis]